MKPIRLAGRSKMISSVPIHLSIYSPNEGQPESIVEDIENMVRSYVEKPNSIILSISPANQSLHLMLPNLHGKWMQQVNERLG